MTTEQCRCLRHSHSFPFPCSNSHFIPVPELHHVHSHSPGIPVGKLETGIPVPHTGVLYYKQSCVVNGLWDMDQIGEIKFGWVESRLVTLLTCRSCRSTGMCYRLHVGASRWCSGRISSLEVPTIWSRLTGHM